MRRFLKWSLVAAVLQLALSACGPWRVGPFHDPKPDWCRADPNACQPGYSPSDDYPPLGPNP